MSENEKHYHELQKELAEICLNCPVGYCPTGRCAYGEKKERETRKKYRKLYGNIYQSYGRGGSHDTTIL